MSTDTNPSDAVETAYRRIAEADRDDIFITLRDQAHARADAADVALRVAKGEALPLAGTITVVKDNIDVAGVPTTAAAPWSAYVPDDDAPVVARLKGAGSVIIGKTNMDQFATGLVGTRTPHPTTTSVLDPTRVSGGSSSGSAVAVALGIADIGLGTDTAGSGRVPAAFNGIVGLKPTLGLFPNTGVVPACPSYDTVSVFARTPDLAAQATSIMAGDPAQRSATDRQLPSSGRLGAPSNLVIAVPTAANLEATSNPWREAFDQAVRDLETGGVQIREVDISPMLQAAVLLYDGALVAERYAGFGERFDGDHPGADPVVAAIVARAAQVKAHELVTDQHHLAAAGHEMRQRLAGTTALLVPTTTHHPTVAEVAAEPVSVNARLGTYTNSVNSLDLCAIAIPYPPAATTSPGFGLTVIADAFEDQLALDVAHRILGTTGTARVDDRGLDLLAVGAHMRGLPLERDLLALGASFQRAVATAPDYTLVAIDGEPPRPGVLPAEPGRGTAIDGELWRISPAGLGQLLTTLPAVLSLGQVRLADGRTVTGFRADPQLAAGATDISGFGGWRSYLEHAAKEMV